MLRITPGPVFSAARQTGYARFGDEAVCFVLDREQLSPLPLFLHCLPSRFITSTTKKLELGKGVATSIPYQNCLLLFAVKSKVAVGGPYFVDTPTKVGS